MSVCVINLKIYKICRIYNRMYNNKNRDKSNPW